MWHPPAGSVALWWEGSEYGQWPLPVFLSGRKLSPGSHLDARHFSSSLHATGAFQAATLVLELRGSESEYVYVGSLRGTAWDSRNFFHQLNLHWFLQPEVMETYHSGTGTLGWESWYRAETPTPEISLPNFYPPYVDVRPAQFLLLVWTNVVSLLL